MAQKGDELEIEIDATGQVQIHTHGIKGKRCLEYVEMFQKMLGPVEDERLTPEFNQVETHAETNTHVQQRVKHS